MKKTLLLLGLFTTICLTACGSKNFNMSFEEALDAANHSDLQDIIAWNDNFEQNFKISGNYNSEWNNIDANISSESKQNIVNNNSESTTNFDVKINNKDSWNTKITWILNIKLVDDTLYLNLWSLDLTWNNELAMIWIATEWIKGQWISIPMTWLSDVPNTLSYFKDSKELNTKIKEIIVNEWSTTYNWKFSQFNGYNAWKISLDNDKFNELIKEYYNAMIPQENTWENSWEINNEIPMINIEDFEWYLVVTWKDKVTTIIENMKMVDNDMIINANWFAWKDYEINISENDKPVIQVTAKKKLSKYEISATITDSINLNWTISPSISKSWISLDFNATLTIKNESKNDITIPFKGSREYKSIQEFTLSAPENSQDINELLWAYLWWMMWWYDYTGEDIYNSYNIYEDNNLDLDNIETDDIEISELINSENTGNTITE